MITYLLNELEGTLIYFQTALFEDLEKLYKEPPKHYMVSHGVPFPGYRLAIRHLYVIERKNSKG